MLVVLNSTNVNFDVIMLSETWLDKGAENVDIRNYNCLNYYRSLNMFNWIYIYIKETIVINNVTVEGIDHCSTLHFYFS